MKKIIILFLLVISFSILQAQEESFNCTSSYLEIKRFKDERFKELEREVFDLEKLSKKEQVEFGYLERRERLDKLRMKLWQKKIEYIKNNCDVKLKKKTPKKNG